MTTLALLLAVVLAPTLGQGRSPQVRPTPPPPCVPGDPCCSRALAGFCRVGCPPPFPTPTFRPAPDVSRLLEPPPNGIAILELGINEEGRVVSACVLRGLRPDVDRAAQDAALRSRWTPKLLDGRPVGVVGAVTYSFPPFAWSRPPITPRSTLPKEGGGMVFVEPGNGCPAGTGGPVRVGSSITNPPLLDYVEPRAPPAPDVTGTVIVEILIDRDGRVSRVKALREARGLTEAAVEAVGKWRYARMCLNGQPVPTIITVALRYGASDAQ